MTKIIEDSKLQYVIERYNILNNVTKASRDMCKHFNEEYNETIGRYYRRKLQELGITNNIVTIEDSKEFKEARKFTSKKSNYYIITWAQAHTKVNEKVLSNIEAYADYLGATIHVVAGRYGNPTSLKASKALKKEEFWDRSITKYLDAKSHQIHEYLTVLSDLKIQPTAKTPLSSIGSFTGDSSCIVGHPSVHLEACPVLDGYPPKIMVTTGAITEPNYTDTKVGRWAKFHHQYGFVIVEIDGDKFHMRQIQMDKKDGSFYDLCYKVEDGVVVKHEEELPVAVLGDKHLGNEEQEAVKASLKLCELLKVKEVVVEDLFDGYTINPHEKSNPFRQMELEGVSLEDEINLSKEFVKDLCKRFKKVTSVSSNHNDFFDRWLMTNDWRYNPHRKEYLKYASIKASGVADEKGIYHYILDQLNIPNLNTLGYSDSYKVMGYELALHYDRGANGSRGSITQFKNLSTKSIGGHGHTPKRSGGALMVGTLTKKRMGYNKGLSNWVHGLVLVYPNGMASHIHIIKGKVSTLV